MFFIIVGAIVTFIFIYSITEMVMVNQLKMEELKRKSFVCQTCQRETKVVDAEHVKFGGKGL